MTMNMNFPAKFLLSMALALFASAFAPAALGQEVAPDALIKNVSDEVLALLKQDKDIRAGNTKKIVGLVEAKVVPHLNFTRMTRLAMGRNWRNASPEQQQQLTEQFRTLLVRTYSTALLNYRDQVIDFKPLRAKPEDTEVTVHSEVKQPGAQPVAIDYDMEKFPAGWKVYDIRVGGISLVLTYRDTFAAEIRERGVDGLIKSMMTKNGQGEANPKAGKT